MAITHSPTFSRLTSPMRTLGSPEASILTTATSVRLSAPTTLALNSRLSVRVTSTSSAPSTTWALVITITVGAEDEARAHAALLRLVVTLATPARRTTATGQRDAEAAEELFHVGVHAATAGRGRTAAAALQGADVDHRRPDPLDQFGEVGQALGAGLRLRLARPAGSAMAPAAMQRAPGGAARDARAGHHRCNQIGHPSSPLETSSAKTAAARWRRRRRGPWASTLAFELRHELLHRGHRHVAHHGDPPVATRAHQRVGRAHWVRTAWDGARRRRAR